MPKPLLEDLRTRLGFTAAEVAAAGGWSRRAYSQLERSAELSVEDALRLNDLFGVDVGDLLDAGKVRGKDVPVATLLKGNADTLTADARFAITEALSVARDVRELEETLGRRPLHAVTSFPEDLDLSHPSTGNAVRLAEVARGTLGISGVIESMVADVTEPLGILVFCVPFTDPLVDAVSTWNAASGPVIIVNKDSAHAQGEYALRVTLAHEVCHLLFDREKMRGVETLCELERAEHTTWRKDHEKIEKRARAFQVELIAPQSQVRQVWEEFGKPTGEDAIVKLSNHFGLGAVAMSWQLKHATEQDFNSGSGLTAALDTARWREASSVATRKEPQAIPPMRRGRLLDLVRDAWMDDEISSSWARELLRVDTVAWDSLAAEWSH